MQGPFLSCHESQFANTIEDDKYDAYIQFDCRIREYLVQKVEDKIRHLINQTSLMKQASHNKLYWDQNFCRLTFSTSNLCSFLRF
jgi:hypothetical protein